jgi:hypothetical protein
MFAAVRPGGAIVVQALNLWRLPDGPCQWQKCRRATLTASSPAEVLILKGVHRCGDRGYVDLVVTNLSGATTMQSESTPFLGLEAPALEGIAKAAGANTVAFFGGYQDEPYDRTKSVDLVMIAEK